MVWERIRELENQERKEREARDARENADRLRREREETERQAEQFRAQQQEQARRERVVKDVLGKSGLLRGVREIEDGLHGLVRKHAVVIRPEEGSVRLVWGNKFVIESNGIINYERGFLSRYGEKDYSYIEALIDPNTESVRVGYKDVKKDEW